MKKVRAAIIGYGNIGHYVLEALQAAPDFEIAGVVRRAGAENKPEELANYAVVKDIKELEGVDVAILCTPTRSVEKYAKEYPPLEQQAPRHRADPSMRKAPSHLRLPSPLCGSKPCGARRRAWPGRS